MITATTISIVNQRQVMQSICCSLDNQMLRAGSYIKNIFYHSEEQADMENDKQRLVISRRYKALQTEGDVTLYRGDEVLFECKSLELVWNDNKVSQSCIPQGKYQAQKHISPTFGKSIWIKDVPDRSEILIHVGNFIGSNIKAGDDPESDGCILVGSEFRDLTGDGINDLVNSRATIDKLYELVKDEIDIIITEQSETGML